MAIALGQYAKSKKKAPPAKTWGDTSGILCSKKGWPLYSQEGLAKLVAKWKSAQKVIPHLNALNAERQYAENVITILENAIEAKTTGKFKYTPSGAKRTAPRTGTIFQGDRSIRKRTPPPAPGFAPILSLAPSRGALIEKMPIETRTSFKEMLVSEADKQMKKAEKARKPMAKQAFLCTPTGGAGSFSGTAEAMPQPSVLGPFKGGPGPCAPKYVVSEAILEPIFMLWEQSPLKNAIAAKIILGFFAKFQPGSSQAEIFKKIQQFSGGSPSLFFELMGQEIFQKADEKGYAQETSHDIVTLCGPPASHIAFLVESLKKAVGAPVAAATQKMRAVKRTPPPPVKMYRAKKEPAPSIGVQMSAQARKQAVKEAAKMAVDVDVAKEKTLVAAKQIAKTAMKAQMLGSEGLAKKLFFMAEQLVKDSKRHSLQAVRLRSYATMLQTGHVDLSGDLHGIFETPIPSQKFIFGLNPMLLRSLGALYVGYRSYQAYSTPAKQAWVEGGIGAAAGAYAPVLATVAAGLFLQRVAGRGGAVRV